MVLANPADKLYAVIAAEREVHDGDIRGTFIDGVLRVVGVGSFAGKDEIRLPRQQLFQSLAHKGMVVDHDDACGIHDR